ncbi:MAG: amidohydrolase family protein [Chloroflexi bacterium]|nr:amidohydrolase family protein [Chloroflexota bacterium]
MSTRPFDQIVKNVRVVRHNQEPAQPLDIGIKAGKFVRIVPQIDPEQGERVFDAHGLLGFPGVIDSHMHVGIYTPVDQDAMSESKAAVLGGVTTCMTYFRTGQYYLNKGGPYADFYPELLACSEGRYYADYCYHIAPISHSQIKEMELLVDRFGMTTFKIFMFYGGHGLHGRSDQQNQFLMIGPDEKYDTAHFEAIMRELAAIMNRRPDLAEYLNLSLHCEWAELLTAYSKKIEQDNILKGLYAYSEARPPHSEALAIWNAAYLAHETGCRNITLLHLSSRKAVEAALLAQQAFPDVNLYREVTAGHLLIDWDAPAGNLAKVNPPIRSREDVEYLWQAVLNHKIHSIVTDHASCPLAMKLDPKDAANIWGAKSGFGGTEYLLSGIFSEGIKRGMSASHIAELLCWNPARKFGLLDKGDIAPGYDADLALLDPNETFAVHAKDSPSNQGYSVFEGMELKGRIKSTFLRGNLVFDQGKFIGAPQGRYLKRPYGTLTH